MPLTLPQLRPRIELGITGRALVAETAPLQNLASTAIPTTGSANGSTVGTTAGLRAGDVVTNVILFCTVAGTSLTFAKAGLFSVSGTSATFLAASASEHAQMNSGTGFKTLALTAPYTVTADGVYYVAYLQWGNGATGATILRSTFAANAQSNQIGTGVRIAGTTATQTDLAAGSITVAADGNAFWFGLS